MVTDFKNKVVIMVAKLLKYDTMDCLAFKVSTLS